VREHQQTSQTQIEGSTQQLIYARHSLTPPASCTPSHRPHQRRRVTLVGPDPGQSSSCLEPHQTPEEPIVTAVVAAAATEQHKQVTSQGCTTEDNAPDAPQSYWAAVEGYQHTCIHAAITDRGAAAAAVQVVFVRAVAVQLTFVKKTISSSMCWGCLRPQAQVAPLQQAGWSHLKMLLITLSMHCRCRSPSWLRNGHVAPIRLGTALVCYCCRSSGRRSFCFCTAPALHRQQKV